MNVSKPKDVGAWRPWRQRSFAPLGAKVLGLAGTPAILVLSAMAMVAPGHGLADDAQWGAIFWFIAFIAWECAVAADAAVYGDRIYVRNPFRTWRIPITPAVRAVEDDGAVKILVCDGREIVPFALWSSVLSVLGGSPRQNAFVRAVEQVQLEQQHASREETPISTRRDSLVAATVLGLIFLIMLLITDL
jgi:hypothetical protein